MENKAHALAAGIFVALLSLLVLGLAAWLTRETGVRDPYEISTRETITGLQEQAPVRFRGVDVGKVKNIGFDPKVSGNVLVRIEVDRDTPLTTATYAQLSYQGVTGLAFIQLADDKPAPRLTLPALDAQAASFTPADLAAGHVSVVNVFASWCAPCRTETAQLAAVARVPGVALYGIAQKDKPQATRAFLDELAIPSPASRATMMAGPASNGASMACPKPSSAGAKAPAFTSWSAR